MTEILSWNEQSGMYLVWFFPLPSVLVWLQKPFSILIKHAISKHCFQKHIGIGRGEQKFLFALLSDGIGIYFLTNFGNFWDFEDKEISGFEKTFNKIRKIAAKFIYSKTGNFFRILLNKYILQQFSGMFSKIRKYSLSSSDLIRKLSHFTGPW